MHLKNYNVIKSQNKNNAIKYQATQMPSARPLFRYSIPRAYFVTTFITSAPHPRTSQRFVKYTNFKIR